MTGQGIARWMVMGVVALGGVGTLLGSGCPPTTPGQTLAYQEYRNISCGEYYDPCLGPCVPNPDLDITCEYTTFDCGWVTTEPVGCDTVLVTSFTVSFQPTAVGRTVTVSVSASSSAIKTNPAVYEGVTRLAGVSSVPIPVPITLTFVSQNTNVHSLFLQGIEGAAIGDVLTMEVRQ